MTNRFKYLLLAVLLALILWGGIVYGSIQALKVVTSGQFGHKVD